MTDHSSKKTTLTYYNLSEYLPSVESGSAPAKVARKGQPRFSRQSIISLPPEPDNTTQTILNPLAPKIIPHEVPLPNLVVWTPVPSAAPVASSARSTAQIQVPNFAASPVMPAPQAASAQLRFPRLSQTPVLEPPPELSQRRIGDINIGHFEAKVNAPSLPVAAQRTANGTGGDQPAPPLSATQGGGSANRAVGQLIALGLNPIAVSGPINIPQGSRRGTFAATPEGKAGASGTPDIAGGGNGPGGRGSGPGGPGKGPGGSNPAGIYVSGGGPATGSGAVVGIPNAPGSREGPGPEQSSSRDSDRRNRALMAAASPSIPRSSIPRSSTPGTGGVLRDDSSLDERVFGGKKYYSLTLNMPNLTSAGGSWIIRFAELKGTRDHSELTAPVAVLKVDPAYPPDLMQDGIEGTVTLYAVIRSDGTVGDVSVLEGIQQRLDENARRALSRWRFRPATKNGSPIDLEAVVTIPFKLRTRGF